MKENQNRQKELGVFLKTRRSRIKPGQAGLPEGTRRRTPGLRREEVAHLAGIGLTWYTWLEQGRAISVSAGVLDSLSRVYLLSEEERRHLYALAGKPIAGPGIDERPVNQPLLRILERLDDAYCPAYVMDQRWNVAAWNGCAAAVFGDFERIPADKRNVVHMMFCNREYMALFDDWEDHAKGIIARFHAAMARHMDDPWLIGFVRDLKLNSEQFSAWWTIYDINGMTDVRKELTHPVMGRLAFEFASFDSSGNPNLKLLIHNPDQDTATRLQMSIPLKSG